MHTNKIPARRNKSLLTVLGFIALSLLSVSIVGVQPARGASMQYFPLAPGSYLTYNTTKGADTWLTRRQIGEDWEFLGGPIFGTFVVHWEEYHQHAEDTEFKWVNRMWLWKTDDTLMWQGFEDENAKFIGNGALAYVKEPVHAGDVQRGSTTGTVTITETGQVIPFAPFSANYTIEAIESVTVPNGTFTNCIRVHEEENTPDGYANFTVWYAPGVGAVRYFYPQENNRWDNLTSYNVDVNNDPWDTWFMPKLPILLGWIVVIGVSLVTTFVVVKVVKKRKMRGSKTPVATEPKA